MTAEVKLKPYKAPWNKWIAWGEIDGAKETHHAYSRSKTRAYNRARRYLCKAVQEERRVQATISVTVKEETC